jgi:hypothetical protein
LPFGLNGEDSNRVNPGISYRLAQTFALQQEHRQREAHSRFDWYFSHDLGLHV